MIDSALSYTPGTVAELAHRALVQLRYQLDGRIDEEESSIWSQTFGREAGARGGRGGAAS